MWQVSANDSRINLAGSIGHAIELSFKSYLRAKGATLDCLKGIGHDLILGLDWAHTAGLVDVIKLTEHDRALVLLLNGYYKAKEFEYRVTGTKKYPHASDLINFLERILVAIEPVCVKSAL